MPVTRGRFHILTEQTEFTGTRITHLRGTRANPVGPDVVCMIHLLSCRSWVRLNERSAGLGYRSDSLNQMPLRNERTAALADAMQADYYRGLVDQERSELARELAKHVKNLTGCMTGGDVGGVSVIRRSIRDSEPPAPLL